MGSKTEKPTLAQKRKAVKIRKPSDSITGVVRSFPPENQNLPGGWYDASIFTIV